MEVQIIFFFIHYIDSEEHFVYTLDLIQFKNH